MESIVKIIQNKPGFVSMSGASDEQVQNAEVSLDLEFANEYREYVSAFGAAAFEGHELTGICVSPRLNVVSVTETERPKYTDLPKNWYVLEQLHMDDVSIWQASSGEVYQLIPGAQPMKLCSSLSEYISG